jgi:hypothetical protein
MPVCRPGRAHEGKKSVGLWAAAKLAAAARMTAEYFILTVWGGWMVLILAGG